MSTGELTFITTQVTVWISGVIASGLHDERIRGLVSVTGVRVSDDLSEAFVGISVLPEKHGELTLHGIRSAAGHIRRTIAHGLRLRRVPRLVFQLDRSLKMMAEVDEALAADRIARNDSDTLSPSESEESSS